MKSRQKTVEVLRGRLLVAFQRKQLLQARGPLLGDATIGAFLQMPVQFPRKGLGNPPFRKIIEQTLNFIALHVETVHKYSPK